MKKKNNRVSNTKFIRKSLKSFRSKTYGRTDITFPLFNNFVRCAQRSHRLDLSRRSVRQPYKGKHLLWCMNNRLKIWIWNLVSRYSFLSLSGGKLLKMNDNRMLLVSRVFEPEIYEDNGIIQKVPSGKPNRLHSCIFKAIK
jgi:hypothetical protein